MIGNGLAMEEIRREETTKMTLWILALYKWTDDGMSLRDEYTGRLFNCRKGCWIIIQMMLGLAEV